MVLMSLYFRDIAHSACFMSLFEHKCACCRFPEVCSFPCLHIKVSRHYHIVVWFPYSLIDAVVEAIYQGMYSSEHDFVSAHICTVFSLYRFVMHIKKYATLRLMLFTSPCNTDFSNTCLRESLLLLACCLP